VSLPFLLDTASHSFSLPFRNLWIGDTELSSGDGEDVLACELASCVATSATGWVGLSSVFGPVVWGELGSEVLEAAVILADPRPTCLDRR
jgi:hypothetical protein